MKYQFKIPKAGIYLLTTVVFLSGQKSYAKKIILDIPDDEIKIVEHDVVDAEQWIKGAWAGKVNNCKGRLAKEERERSIKEGAQMIPASDDGLVQKAMARPDLESRKERDLREEKERARPAP